MLNKKRITDNVSAKPSTISETFSKAMKSNASWTDKDEFLDVVYWMRQVLGLAMGLIWGTLALKGIIGLVLFFAINAVIVYVYTNIYQKVDEEEYGGVLEILKEGLMTSFATFLISWIILYSALYFD